MFTVIMTEILAPWMGAYGSVGEWSSARGVGMSRSSHKAHVVAQRNLSQGHSSRNGTPVLATYELFKNGKLLKSYS